MLEMGRQVVVLRGDKVCAEGGSKGAQVISLHVLLAWGTTNEDVKAVELVSL